MKIKKYAVKSFITFVIITVTMFIYSLPVEAKLRHFRRRIGSSHGQKMNAQEFLIFAGGILLFFAIVITLIVIASKKAEKRHPKSKSTTQDRTQEISQKITKNDPHFNLAEFLNFSENVTVKIIKARNAYDYEALKLLESEELFSRDYNDLRFNENQSVSANTINISAGMISLTDYETDLNSEKITVSVSCNISSHSGIPSDTRLKKYMVTFEKPKEIWTTGQYSDKFCHNCGTEISPDTLRCPVCGTVITSDHSGWSVINFKEI